MEREYTNQQQVVRSKKPVTKIVFVVLGLVLISGAAYRGWKFFSRPKPETEQPKPEQQATNWRVYRNGEHGFEIKYPGDWNAKDYYKEIEDEVLLNFTIFSDKPLPIAPGRVETLESIFIMVENRSFEEARGLFEYEELTSSLSEEEIIVDGVNALRQSATHLYGRVETKEERVLIFKNNKVYMLTAYEPRLPTFNQMLSTFRFVE